MFSFTEAPGYGLLCGETTVLSNVIGFDDAPFERCHRGDVTIFGTIFSRTRMDGLLTAKVRRDGTNSTQTMARMVRESQFADHVQAVLLDGIAVAGFNVVDIHGLSERLGIPVLVVTRRPPDLTAIRETLERHTPGGARKWKLIEKAGPPEPLRELMVQRAGLTTVQARDLLANTTLHGKLPEPLRVAHLIAGGVTLGVSRGRA